MTYSNENNMHDELLLEGLREDFYQACAARDWEEAKDIIAYVASYGINTSILERDLATEMVDAGADVDEDGNFIRNNNQRELIGATNEIW